MRFLRFILTAALTLLSCAFPSHAVSTVTATPPSAGQVPILFLQIIDSANATGGIIGRTLAVFPAPPVRRVTIRPDMATAFWSGDHRRVLSLGGRSLPATVRTYDSAQGRFGPPLDAVQALADPSVRYTLPLHDITETNAIDWSRDGRTLCYAQEKVGLVLFDLRRGTRQILRNPFLAHHPVAALAFSPDGSRIAFSVEGQDEFHEELFQDLWVIGRDGRGLHKLGHGTFPNWSPQGRFLLATEGPADDGGRAILRYDTQTGTRRVLRLIPQPTEGDGYFAQARYSPDGQQIAVFGPPNPRVPDDTALFLMDGQGKRLRILATRQQLDQSGIPTCLSW